MTAQIVPCYFAPDIDNAWSAAPGALASINAFAPLQNGNYGSVGTANYFGSSALTGSDILSAKTFRKVDNTVRLLVFRPGNIDEYDYAASRTNRGTGYNASTERWSATSWGDQIIACNYLDATQSSTGAGFTALSGDATPPKAAFAAANLNFVMLGKINAADSADMVQWCGIRNPNAWATSLSTQASYQRLLEAPGPLTGLVAFRQGFIAFKAGAFWQGTYVGPANLIFQWVPLSLKVGCIAPESIAELDGKLYWLSANGFMEYDGQSLRQVGLPVDHSFQSEGGYVFIPGWGNSFIVSNTTAEELEYTQATVDEVEGVVWFRTSYQITATHAQTVVLYGYNPRSGKWARHVVASVGTGVKAYPRLVNASYYDARTFKPDTQGRLWMVWNGTTTTLRSMRYPYGATDATAPSYTTGTFGSVDGSDYIDKHYIRTTYGTESGALSAATISGFTTEDQLLTNGSIAGSINTEFNEVDCLMNARFKNVQMTFALNKRVLLTSVGFNGKPGGKR